MKLYADVPARRAAQLATDALVVAGIVLFAVLGHAVHDVALKLAAPGHRIQSSAADLASRLHDAGSALGGVPVVGDGASKPFAGAGRAAENLAAAGQGEVDAATSLANWLGVVVFAVPVVLLLAFYLPPRIRFVRAATAGQRLLDSGADLDLFALRALAHQPLHVLARIDADPAGAWRRGDPGVIDRLGRYELRAVGLHPPRPPGGPGA